MCITNLAANLKSLGETLEDTRIIKKFLRVVPPHFHSVVVSIEMFCDLKKLTVEELIGHLRAAEERFDEKVEQITDKAGWLLLAEEDWLEKHKHRFQVDRKDGGGSGSGGGSTGATSGSAGHWKAKSVAHSDGGGSGSGRLTSEGMPRWKGRCHNCNIYGHWAEDCKRPKREKKKKEAKQPKANVAVQGDHGAVLLMAAVASVHSGSAFAGQNQAGTPSTNASKETWGAPLRFRSLNDLFDSTEMIHDFEYSGVCMLAADEPMMNSFNMSDLGLLSYYLGMEVKQQPGEITICQSSYAEKIVEICGMKGCNPIGYPNGATCKVVARET
ncbi:unnamed protein product [Miscanthus lutarioriparius]|uniref:CCHC-type domain-containing protein n=1 Tax=Miscanthus lutarioriparius TaxID=422564 RepID=A0A811RYS7_9POAL|nr:unnamed protein product [Miscanthus lutarioriparius]